MSGVSGVRPLIGVTGELKAFENVEVHAVGHKYVMSVIEATDGIPVLIAALGDDDAGGHYPIEELVDRLDGLLLTGGRSNVEPHHYGGDPFRESTLREPNRDATVLPLARAAVDAGVPLLGICRGHQEVNVALGGTLHPYLWEVEGVADHRMPKHGTVDDKFVVRHPVRFTQGGQFAAWAREAGIDGDEIMVNSLHGQGVDRLADGLDIEAVSDDGVIEGFTVRNAVTFAAGVQWHAEYRIAENPFAQVLYGHYATACRARAIARTAHGRVA